jgi:hypothetical protein
VTAELPTNPRRMRHRARSIAAFFGKPEKWLRNQLVNAKRPPPVWRTPNGELVAYEDELIEWLETRKIKYDANHRNHRGE